MSFNQTYKELNNDLTEATPALNHLTIPELSVGETSGHSFYISLDYSGYWYLGKSGKPQLSALPDGKWDTWDEANNALQKYIFTLNNKNNNEKPKNDTLEASDFIRTLEKLGFEEISPYKFRRIDEEDGVVRYIFHTRNREKRTIKSYSPSLYRF